jgi:O-antigen/teichoic acid export membrane protein
VVASRYEAADQATFFAWMTMASVVSPIAMRGLNTSAVRMLGASQGSSAQRDAGASVIGLWLRGAAVALTLATLVTLPWWWSQPTRLFVVISIVFFFPLCAMVGGLMQGSGRFEWALLLTNTMSFILIAVAVLAVGESGIAADRGPEVELAVAMLLGTMTAAVLAVFAGRRMLVGSLREQSVAVNAAEANQFWVVQVFIVLNNWAPALAFYVLEADADFAAFNVGQRLANIVNFFIVMANFFLAPHIAGLWARGDTSSLRSSYIRVTRLTTAMCLPFALVLVVGAEQILGVFGDAAASDSRYLILLVATQFFNVATGSSNIVLNMTGNSRAVVISMATAFAVGSVVGLVLYLVIGGFGLAVGLSTTLVVQNIMTVWFVRERTGIRTSEAFLPRRRPPSSLHANTSEG